MAERRRTSEDQRKYDSDYGKQYRLNNWSDCLNRMYEWRKKNPETWKQIKRRSERRREQQIQTSVLSSSDRREIEDFYGLRDWLTETTGIEHHVDHIKPLSKGGLHIPENLQVIPAIDNLKKGSKYEPNEMAIRTI